MTASTEGELAAKPAVLLIEDDDDVAFGVAALVDANGRFSIERAATAAEARQALGVRAFDVVLADLSLPDEDGFRLLEEISSEYPTTGLLCLTGRNDASAAVRALRAGASDYLTKPAAGAHILQALANAANRSMAGRNMLRLEGSPKGHVFPVGTSPAWRQAMSLVEAAAQTPRITVLITGEHGVGKEEAASLLHRLSKRSDGPFVPVNAACLSPQLIESELFGHEAGAFTGAVKQRRGLFEQAAGGTLFLDEIGELPLELQSKLLRVLEGHPFRRVGGERPVTVEARLVCATNRRLDECVRAGTFRADLYERLRGFEIVLPPLRERPGDVAHLAQHFIAKLGPQFGYRSGGISASALEALEAHSFPGNVRELRNLIERALVLARDGNVERRHLPPDLRGSRPSSPMRVAAPIEEATGEGPSALDDVVREHILKVYERSGRNVTHTATLLGMSRLAVRKRLQSYGVRSRPGEDAEDER
jgi:two-component system, NtrC family, response regulator HydG